MAATIETVNKELSNIVGAVPTYNGGADLIPNGTCQSLAVTSATAVSLSAFPAGTVAFRIAVKTASVNMRADGIDPTTTVGEQLDAGFKETWPVEWQPLAEFIALSTTANVFAIPLKLRP